MAGRRSDDRRSNVDVNELKVNVLFLNYSFFLSLIHI